MCGHSPRRAHSGNGIDHIPYRLVRRLELGDLDRLVHRHIAEHLGRPARRPVDLQHGDPIGLAQTDRLPQRLAPKLLPEVICR